MAGVDKIFVSLILEGQEHEVGELVLSEQKIYFRYHPSFLRTGLNLSPIKLPFNGEINTPGEGPFDGLFGVFNDSLPDGMGAVTYKPEIVSDSHLSRKLELDSIVEEMNHILKGDSSDIIEELFMMGGSSGGARPKIFVAYNPNTKEIVNGIDRLVDGFEDWMIKFPSTSDMPENARIEYAYHRMAVRAGIQMSECKLFEGKSGRVYFGTKRFDRNNNKRLHVHSASGLMHDNYRASTLDYGHLMDFAFKLEKHVKAYEKVFRLAAFNVFAHNRDDHSKNFSFLMNVNGQWTFAPAYDLTFSYSSYGFHSTMIAGESQNPGKKHLMKLAQHFGLRNGDRIIEEVQDAVAKWDILAIESGVGKDNVKRIKTSLEAIAANN